jgi:uncharacterized protein (DUF2267 family)
MTNSSRRATTPDLAGPEIIQALSPVVPPHVRADDALIAVMCTLAQRLTRGEAQHLLVSLPVSVGTFFSNCALQRDEAADTFDLRGFFDRVALRLKIPVDAAEPITRRVISLVQRRLPPEVFEHVASQLPADIELMWREAAVAAGPASAQGG